MIADGTSGHSMGFSDKNPFGRSVFLPTLYVFKVHKNHPLRIMTAGKHFSHIYPLSDFGKTKRMPAKVCEDKMAYDLSALFLLPYVTNTDNSAWKSETLKDGFTSVDGKKFDASLLYLTEQGFSMHSCDTVKVSHVMPSQVYYHIMDWMEGGHHIYSHEKTFDQKLEGRISVSMEDICRVSSFVTWELQNKYKSKLFLNK